MPYLYTAFLLCKMVISACFDCCRIQTKTPRYNANSSATPLIILSKVQGRGLISTRLYPMFGVLKTNLCQSLWMMVVCASQRIFTQRYYVFEIALSHGSYGSMLSALIKPI